MRRTREFWARLEPEERSLLVALERAPKHASFGGGGYLPDGCSECTFCGQPIVGYGPWCSYCNKEYGRLIDKAEGR